MSRYEATLAVLVGGESSRMGTSKALIQVGQHTLPEIIVERLRPLFDQVVICGRPDQVVPQTLVEGFTPDLHPGWGPLAGIESALAAASNPLVLCVACDMPLIRRGLAELLLGLAACHDVVVPRIEGQLEMTCAVYRRTVLPLLRESLEQGVRTAWKALAAWQSTGRAAVRYVDQGELACAGLGPDMFVNLNTPEDLQAVQIS